MPWNTDDKQELWGVLELERDQLINGSVFDYLMDFAEDFDTNNSTTIVSDIQDLLTEISTLNSTYPISYDGGDNIKRREIKGQLEIEYQDNTNTSVNVQNQVDSLKAKILNLLDPYKQLSQYTNPYNGRVIN